MRNKKAEIGTIVMMALLVLVSVVAFGSSNFLAKKQTVNTKAATGDCNDAGGPYQSPSGEDEPGTPSGKCSLSSESTPRWGRCMSGTFSFNPSVDPGCSADPQNQWADQLNRCCLNNSDCNSDYGTNYGPCGTSTVDTSGTGTATGTGTGTGTTTSNLKVQGNGSTDCLKHPNGCGSGNGYKCTTDNGCAPTQCTTANLEFACCVADQHQADDTYRIQWYGCFGQPCQNTGVSGTYLGHLAGCVGYSTDYQGGYYSLNGNAVAFPAGGIPGSSGNTPTPTPTPTVVSTPTNLCPASVGSCLNYCTYGEVSAADNDYCSMNSDKNLCCKKGPTITNTPIPTRTPTPIPCSPSSSTCSSSGKVYNYFIFPACLNRNTDYCYGMSANNCKQYDWNGINNYNCGTNFPTGAPPITPGAVNLTSIPIPTLTLTPNICHKIGCSSINALDTLVTDLWIKTTGLQNNYYKNETDCNKNRNNISSIPEVAHYCMDQKRTLLFTIKLNITSQLSDAKPNSIYSLNIITPTLPGSMAQDMSIWYVDITNNMVPSYNITFTRERLEKYNVQFCYETNEREQIGFDQWRNVEKCLNGSEGYKSYSEVMNGPTFTINIGG